MLEKTTEFSLTLPSTSHQPTIDPLMLSAALRISVAQGRTMCVIMSQSLTTMGAIEQRTGLSPEGRRTLIHRLRARLKPRKIRIISHPGLGYSIPQEDRLLVLEIVDKFRGQGT